MEYFLKTFGCQMNVHDSEKIAGIFSESGYEQSEDAADADVIENTNVSGLDMIHT